MKKNHFYLIAIVLFIVAAGFIVVKYKKDEKIKAAVFYPSDPLAPDTTYTATITTGVQNLSGQPLASKKVWTFTTGNGESPRIP